MTKRSTVCGEHYWFYYLTSCSSYWINWYKSFQKLEKQVIPFLNPSLKMMNFITPLNFENHPVKYISLHENWNYSKSTKNMETTTSQKCQERKSKFKILWAIKRLKAAGSSSTVSSQSTELDIPHRACFTRHFSELSVVVLGSFACTTPSILTICP